MHGKGTIPIWFFIGSLLVVYGFLVTGAGVWELFHPPAQPVVLAELRMNLWWGALLLIVGGVYVGRFSPW